MCNHFLFFPINAVVFECPSLWWLAPKGRKREKWRRVKGISPLSPLEFTSTKWGGACHSAGRGLSQCRDVQQRWPPSFICTSVIRSNNQDSEHRFPNTGKIGFFFVFLFFIPTPAPRGCLWAALGTCIQLPSMGYKWMVGRDYCANYWNWLKLTAINHPNLPLEAASLQ